MTTNRSTHRSRASSRVKTKPSIEVRHATLDDGSVEFDEIVASGAIVHLEKMNGSTFCLIVETSTERACFFIGPKRAKVDAWELWREALVPARMVRA